MAEFHLSLSFQSGTFHNSLKEADPFLPARFCSLFSTLCSLAQGPKSLLLIPAQRSVVGSLTLDPVLAGSGGRPWGARPADRPPLLPLVRNLQPMAGPGAGSGSASWAPALARIPPGQFRSRTSSAAQPVSSGLARLALGPAGWRRRCGTLGLWGGAAGRRKGLDALSPGTFPGGLGSVPCRSGFQRNLPE